MVSTPGSSSARPVWSTTPTLRVERALLREGHALVAGMDEVGRGALAGPVSVGIVVVDAACRTAPSGLKDSKLLAPAVRQRLVPRIRRWAVDHAVGHASAAEIDEVGLIAALRRAGQRAMAGLRLTPDFVVLDGNHDWLTPPPIDLTLFDLDAPTLLPASTFLPQSTGAVAGSDVDAPPVRTLIKADQRCASVAAASVLAKCERDGLMQELAPGFPTYQWEANKGYGSPEHLAALRELGPSHWHRRSWRLPVTDDSVDDSMDDSVDGADEAGTTPCHAVRFEEGVGA